MTIIDKIRRYWNLHIYTKRHLTAFVEKGVITMAQYEAVVGDAYPSGGEGVTA